MKNIDTGIDQRCRPRDRCALRRALAGAGHDPVRAIHLPTCWAATPALRFLITRSEFENLISAAGLERMSIADTTVQVIANGHQRRAALRTHDPKPPTIDVIVRAAVATKMNEILKPRSGPTNSAWAAAPGLF